MGWLDNPASSFKSLVDDPKAALSNFGHEANPVTMPLNALNQVGRWAGSGNMINPGDINTLGDTTATAAALYGAPYAYNYMTAAPATEVNMAGNLVQPGSVGTASSLNATSGVGAAAGGAGGGGFWSSPYAGMLGLNALTSLYGYKLQSDAANQAADKAAAASAAANAMQAPYLAAGTQAMNKQLEMMNNPNAYKASPYNAFLTNQGEQAIQRQSAARGGLDSGAVLAALSKYNQDQAGAGFGQQFDRYGSIAGHGPTAAANMGRNAMDLANIQGNAGMVAAGNQAQLINSLANTGMMGYGMYRGRY